MRIPRLAGCLLSHNSSGVFTYRLTPKVLPPLGRLPGKRACIVGNASHKATNLRVNAPILVDLATITRTNIISGLESFGGGSQNQRF